MTTSDYKIVRAHVPHMYLVRGFVKPHRGPYVNQSFWGSNYNINPYAEAVPPKSDPNATYPLDRGRKYFEIKDDIWPPRNSEARHMQDAQLLKAFKDHLPKHPQKIRSGKSDPFKARLGKHRAHEATPENTNWRALAQKVQRTDLRGKAPGVYEPHLIRQRPLWYLEALPADVFAPKNQEYAVVQESSTSRDAANSAEDGNSVTSKAYSSGKKSSKSKGDGEERLYFPRLVREKWKVNDTTGSVRHCIEAGHFEDPGSVSHGTQTMLSLVLPNADV